MTRDEIMQLDDDALRIAVARALGWEIEPVFSTTLHDEWYAHRNTVGSVRDTPIAALEAESLMLNENTDYPRDIAAAFELEDALPVERRVLRRRSGRAAS